MFKSFLVLAFLLGSANAGYADGSVHVFEAQLAGSTSSVISPDTTCSVIFNAACKSARKKCEASGLNLACDDGNASCTRVCDTNISSAGGRNYCTVRAAVTAKIAVRKVDMTPRVGSVEFANARQCAKAAADIQTASAGSWGGWNQAHAQISCVGKILEARIVPGHYELPESQAIHALPYRSIRNREQCENAMRALLSLRSNEFIVSPGYEACSKEASKTFRFTLSVTFNKLFQD